MCSHSAECTRHDTSVLCRQPSISVHRAPSTASSLPQMDAESVEALAGLDSHRLGPHLLSAARMYTLVTAPRHTRLSPCPRLIYSTSIVLCCRAVSQNDNGPLRLPRVKCNFWYLRGGELTPCTNPDKLAIASLPPSHHVLAFLVILLKDAAQEPSQSASQRELTASGKAACDRLNLHAQKIGNTSERVSGVSCSSLGPC